MKNAWNELIDKLEEIYKTTQDIQWAKILYRHFMNDDENEMSIYFPGDKRFDTFEDFKNVLKNINYENRFGGQQLFGFVVFTDNSWLERGEYDGFEWWEYKRTPVFNCLDEWN